MSHLSVLKTPGADASPVSQIAYEKAIRSQEISDATQSVIARLVNSKRYKIPEFDAQIGIEEAESRWGRAYVMGKFNGEQEIITRVVADRNFPTVLRDNRVAGLDKDQATDTAAVFVRSLEVVYRSLTFATRRNGRIVPNFQPTIDQDVWPAAYKTGHQSLCFRAAGLVALEYAGIEPLDLPVEEYPVHIAALVNPLDPVPTTSTRSFRDLSAALNNFSKQQIDT